MNDQENAEPTHASSDPHEMSAERVAGGSTPRTPPAEDGPEGELAPVPALSETERAAAQLFFGEKLELASRFVEHLCTTGVEYGLLGPREVPRMWSRHVLNCAALAPELKAGSTVADVGSGAGLPGIALALARPDCEFTLIEPMERRVQWMDHVVRDLGVDNVELIRARAEEVTDEVMTDVVTARAVSSLKSLIPMTAPLLADRGRLMLLKGRSADDEIRAAQKALNKFKLGKPRVRMVGAEVLETPTTIVECTRR